MKKIFSLLVLLWLIVSCAVSKKRPDDKSYDKSRRFGVTLVAGGLGVHGLSLAGVLRTFEKEEIPIKSLIAFQTSSFVAALYAESENSLSTEWKASQLSLSKYYSEYGIFSGSKSYASLLPFRAYILSKMETKKIEDLKINLSILATDLMSGDSISIERGSIASAILASNAIPGIFQPIVWGRQLLMSPAFGREFTLPEDDVLVFIDIQEKRKLKSLENQKDLILKLHETQQRKWNTFYKEKADLVISLDLSDVDFHDFSKKNEVIYKGREEADKYVEQVKKLLNL